MNKKKNFFLRHKWLFLGLICAGIAVYVMYGTSPKNNKKSYVTMDITRGNLSQTVTHNGFRFR